jgi:hypothetical protein
MADLGARAAPAAAVASADPGDAEAIARQIQGLAARLVGLAAPGQCASSSLALLAKVRAAHADRQRRAIHFDPRLFSDPAWDILVYLFLCHLEGRSATVTEACHASPSAATTSLRHVTHLTRLGLVRRVAHPRDGRSSFVDLTSPAIAKLKVYFAEGD